MMKPLLSIITPCYNSFNLMKKSMDTFIEWGDVRLEWVIVDDRSKDDSYSKLLEFRDRYKQLNISVYQNEKNAGPGVARNLGVQKAKGKYISFLDSDDFFDSSYWSVIKPEIDRERDCIIFDSCFYYDDAETKYWPLFRNGQSEGKVSTVDAIVHVLGAPWGKVYRRDIIIDNKVIFLPQKSNEDNPFTKHAVSCCKDIFYIKKPLYFYVQRSNSLVHDTSLFDFSNTLNSFIYIRENIENRYPKEVEALFVSMFLYSMALQTYTSLSKKDYLQALSRAEGMYPNYYSNSYLSSGTLQQKIVIACVHYKFYIGIKFVLWLMKIRNQRLYKVKKNNI